MEIRCSVPMKDYDPIKLSEDIFEAGYEDAIIGTGKPGVLAVDIEDDDISSLINILTSLPEGSTIIKVRATS